MTDAPKTIAEMREAAAKVATGEISGEESADRWNRGWNAACKEIAALIRAIPLPVDDAEMVEKVARAIAWAACGDLPTSDDRRIARAALSAMRGEP